MGEHLPVDEKPAKSCDRDHQRNKPLGAVTDSDQRNTPKKSHDCQQKGEDLTTGLHRLPMVNLAFRELHDALRAVNKGLVVLTQQLRMGQGASELDTHALNDRCAL